ncbi:MAG: PRC-barrel domain-containing protein [Acidimicrobiales bacterium]
MGDSVEYTIGSEVACEDGPVGELVRVVVDPIKRIVTHLVVQPKHHGREGRLVPVGLVDPSSDPLKLHCTLKDFDALEAAEETRLLSGAPGSWGYAQHEMHSLPYFPLTGAGGGLMGAPGAARLGSSLWATQASGVVEGPWVGGPSVVTYEKIPAGEVDVRRGDHVHATDGHIGRVQGLVVDPADHGVTHILLDEGHLWGQKEVAIPIGAVGSVEGDGAHLKLSKDEVRDLPALDLGH